MPKDRPYATLDACILATIRRTDGRGVSHSSVATDGRVMAFARKFAMGKRGFTSAVASARLQSLRTRGIVVNNGVSGDGCRWYAAP